VSTNAQQLHHSAVHTNSPTESWVQQTTKATVRYVHAQREDPHAIFVRSSDDKMSKYDRNGCILNARPLQQKQTTHSSSQLPTAAVGQAR